MRQVRTIILQTLKALADLHKSKIAHRNLNPLSVLIDDYSNTKIGFFDQAKFMSGAKDFTYYLKRDFKGHSLSRQFLSKQRKSAKEIIEKRLDQYTIMMYFEDKRTNHPRFIKEDIKDIQPAEEEQEDYEKARRLMLEQRIRYEQTQLIRDVMKHPKPYRSLSPTPGSRFY